MADPAKDLSEARKHAAPAWGPERERAVRARVERAVVLRARGRNAVVVLAALVVAMGAALVWNRPSLTALDEAAPPRAAEPVLLRLPDGSNVTPISAGAEVEPIGIGATEVAVRLKAGSARFSVTPDAGRAFRVLARGTTVTVLGTVFTVGLGPNGTQVAVERGRVRVAWAGGERELGAGDSARFPDGTAAPREPSVEEPLPEAVKDRPDAAARPPSSGAAVPSWRALAQDGNYAAAFERMTAEGPRAVKDEPGDLLLAADVARLGGRPERAVGHLERVLSAHRGDSRSPLAAFTLGRTLLDQLGRPREAAEAFARAERLAPRGALAQDALAREVESWARAGEASVARQRALEYVARYPKGRRLAAVKRLGEIE